MQLVIAVCVLGVIGAYPVYDDSTIELMPVVSMIKGILSTDYGYNLLKEYVLDLDGNELAVQEIQSLFQEKSDEVLKNAINAFFANIPYLAIEPLPDFQYPTLPELFQKVKAFLNKDDGLTVLKNYIHNLNTENELLKEILSEVLILDDSDLKYLIALLFSNIPDDQIYAAPGELVEQLKHTLGILKAIVTQPAGIQEAREIINGIKSTHPTMILAKTVLSSMSDRTLIDLVKEVGKDIQDVEPGHPKPEFFPLLKEAKKKLATDSGIDFLIKYFHDLKTGNFLLAQVKNLLQKRTKEELIAQIIESWKNLFGED